MTAGFILTVFFVSVVMFIAKAPQELLQILLMLAWMGMLLAILWAVGRLAYVSFLG